MREPLRGQLGAYDDVDARCELTDDPSRILIRQQRETGDDRHPAESLRAPAPGGLWAASRTSGGFPSSSCIRPGRSSPVATAWTRSGSSGPSTAAAAALATAKLRRA